MRRKPGTEIESAQMELEAAKGRYLRSHGWRYTSSTPGCLWMWVKECDFADHEPSGEPRQCMIMVDTDTAVSMQRHSCAIRGNKW